MEILNLHRFLPVGMADILIWTQTRTVLGFLESMPIFIVGKGFCRFHIQILLRYAFFSLLICKGVEVLVMYQLGVKYLK